MPKNVTINITDDNASPPTNCTNYYQVVYWYGQNAKTQITVLPPLSQSGGVSYISLTGLVDSQTYNYQITRFCCNGIASTAATGTFNT
jgi:hypothetical protein